MGQFPKARPTPGGRGRRGPRSLRTHVAKVSTIIDLDKVGICDECGHRNDHRIHDVAQSAEATEIDARRLGETPDE